MTEAFEDKQDFGSFSPSSEDLIQVKVLNDGFAAALYVPEDSGSFPSMKQVHLAIENANVHFGVNEKAIKKFVDEQFRGKGLIFAKGSTPGGGSVARLIWNYISEEGAAPHDITDQLLSNRILHNFTVVKDGDGPLVCVFSLTAGEGGRTKMEANKSVKRPTLRIVSPSRGMHRSAAYGITKQL